MKIWKWIKKWFTPKKEIGLREGGMARGGGAAIRGTNFKGVF